MKLSIPENIPLEWELVKGLGKKEIIQCLTVLIPGLVLAVILVNVLSTPTAPLAVLMGYILLVASCYLFFARLDQYQSVYLFLRRSIQFQREQQKFYYKRRTEAIVYETETDR